MNRCQVGQSKRERSPNIGTQKRRLAVAPSTINCRICCGHSGPDPLPRRQFSRTALRCPAASAPVASRHPLTDSKSPQHLVHPVQIFDVAAGQIIKTLENGPRFQAYARSWLSGVKGLSPSLGPQDKCGYVFRIPLDQPVPLQVGELSFHVQDVFLFYCIDREPELLVFDAKYRPYLLSVTVDPAPFLSEIGLKP